MKKLLVAIDQGTTSTRAILFSILECICENKKLQIDWQMNIKIINTVGWVLFLISAIGFIMSSLGNFWSMFGSVFFFVGCLVFLIPYLRKED